MVGAPVDEKWDRAMIVRYENLEGFRKMVECREYKKMVEPHRLAGLEDWRLVLLDRERSGVQG